MVFVLYERTRKKYLSKISSISSHKYGSVQMKAFILLSSTLHVINSEAASKCSLLDSLRFHQTLHERVFAPDFEFGVMHQSCKFKAGLSAIQTLTEFRSKERRGGIVRLICLFCGRVFRSEDEIDVHIIHSHTRLAGSELVCPQEYSFLAEEPVVCATIETELRGCERVLESCDKTGTLVTKHCKVPLYCSPESQSVSRSRLIAIVVFGCGMSLVSGILCFFSRMKRRKLALIDIKRVVIKVS